MPDNKPLQILPLRAFKDNYIWALRRGGVVAIVDPGDAQPVLDYLAAEGLRLAAILATHHHPDHVGGIAELLQTHPVPVYGPLGEPIAELSHRVKGGDRVELAELGVALDVLDIPGHTRAHIGYYGANILFCGDTLFACGCGRVFEGTPRQLHASLEKLMALPDDTQVYCAHEYTLSNIAFAKAVEPDNAALAERERRETTLRQNDRPTLPSTIRREKDTNPFVRVTHPDVIAAANRHLGHSAGGRIDDPAAVFTALREWKNRF